MDTNGKNQNSQFNQEQNGFFQSSSNLNSKCNSNCPNCNSNWDTCKSIDERYKLCESDMELTHIYETFGTRRINLAIVGLGRMGAIHLYNVLREPRANLLYILDEDNKRLDFLEKKYFLSERGVKVLHASKQMNQIVEDASLDAVIIATPTFTHGQYCRTALTHNKHVLCEKPLAGSLEETVSLVELAAERNLKLICAFQRRYDPSFRKIAEQIQRGDIGQVRIIKTCSRDSPPPPLEYIKISGGIYHDCFVHDLDVILWYANELPVEVHAFKHTYDEDYKALDDFDTSVVCLKFGSGLISCTDLSRKSACGYEQRIEVFGPKGVLKIDELTRVGWEKHNELGVIKAGHCYSFASHYNEAYANELIELFNQIEGFETNQQTGPGYLQALCKITNATEQSARLGKPVKMEWLKEELANSF